MDDSQANIFTASALLDFDHSIAAPLFEKVTYAWEALSEISDFILALGDRLDPEAYEKHGENIWISKTAKVAESALITGPCIIDHEAEVRHCAFIRGSAIVGKHAVCGNSTELKNCILFDNVQVPHYNYVGDSILGYKAHMGAGAITSNVKSDKSLVVVRPISGAPIETNRKKFGAIVGDFTEVGCNAVLNPGTVLGRHVMIYPTSCVRGVLPEYSIMKNNGETIPRTAR